MRLFLQETQPSLEPYFSWSLEAMIISVGSSGSKESLNYWKMGILSFVGYTNRRLDNNIEWYSKPLGGDTRYSPLTFIVIFLQGLPKGLKRFLSLGGGG